MRISDWSSDVCSSDLDEDKTACAAPFAIREVFLLLTRFNALQRMSNRGVGRSEEHTSELQSLMRISYAVFCLKYKIFFSFPFFFFFFFFFSFLFVSLFFFSFSSFSFFFFFFFL